MFRPSCLAALASILAGASFAQVTPDALRALALAGDVEGLEAAFAEVHEAAREGRLTPDEVRAFGRPLHLGGGPVWTVVDDWLRARPDSPYANATRAWQLDARAWGLRGTAPARDTWPEAMAGFVAAEHAAWVHGLRAHEAAPDFVPGSDALLALDLHVGELSDADFDTLLAEVMEATPNHGTLLRAAGRTRVEWGGGGPDAAWVICTTYAPVVTDAEGYDADACMAEIILRQGFGGPIRQVAADVALSRPEPWLDRARLEVARFVPVAGGDRLLREAVADRLASDLSLTDTLDLALTHDVAHALPDGRPGVFGDVLVRVQAEARDTLRLHPADPEAIDALLWSMAPAGVELPHASPEERTALLRARLGATPYDPETWSELARASLDIMDPLDERHLPYGINAIVYSNHGYNELGALLGGFDARLMAANWPRGLVPEYPSLPEEEMAALLDRVLCPIVRAQRLADAACEEARGMEAAQCRGGGPAPRIAAAVDYAEAGGFCPWERAAPVASLSYTPVPLPEE